MKNSFSKSKTYSSTARSSAFSIFKVGMMAIVIFLIAFTITLSAGAATVKRGKTTKKTCQYTHYCSYTINKNGIDYKVKGYAKYERNCGENSFPSWGCEYVKNEIIERISPSLLSSSWNLSCGNTHGFSAQIVSQGGSCGSSNGATFSTFPTSNLCSVGSATNTSSDATHFYWTCAGAYGGSSTNCSALKSSAVKLSCTPSVATGVVNSAVTFTAGITGTTTPITGFTFDWKVNGQSNADDHTFVKTFTEATSTAEVIVTATRGVFTQTANCNFSRVDCSGGQYYCGDQGTPTSYSCVAGPSSCPASSCGVGYDISLDKQLPAGGFLATSTPSAGYITSNALCGSGSVLRYIGGNSTWEFNAGYNAWGWSCAHPQALGYASCKARCATGEYYCKSQGKCVSDGAYCGCTIVNSQGVSQVYDQRGLCTDSNGDCYACGKVVAFFSLSPNEIHKNQNTKLCGGYWATAAMTEDQIPEGATGSRVVCSMSSNGTEVSVPANNPTGGAAYDLPIGVHTLTCTQQYELDSNWVDFLSGTVENRCRALPGVSEN